MEHMKRFLSHINGSAKVLAMSCLTIMVLIVTYQVVTRYVLNSTPAWAESTALLFLVWFSFIGIAIGFREKLHISIGFVYDMFSSKVQRMIDIATTLLIVTIGALFLKEGIEFCLLMAGSTIPGTQVSSSVLYAAIPTSGALIIIFGIERLYIEFVSSSGRSER